MNPQEPENLPQSETELNQQQQTALPTTTTAPAETSASATPQPPQPQPPINPTTIYGQANAPLPPKKPFNKKLTIIASLAVALIAVVVSAILLLVIVPQNNAKKFSEDSKTILNDLSKQVSDMQYNSFVKAKNSTESYDAAKIVLKQKIQELNKTNSEIQKLKTNYGSLKPTNKNTEEAKKIDDAFSLAGAITDEYGASLDFRQATFDAYGELPNELDKYVQTYSKGGLRADFVDLTKTIKELSQDGLNKLANIKVPPDDAELYRLRLGYLNNNQQTFARLNGYYRTVSDDKVEKELVSYSKKNLDFNKRIKKEIDRYVTESKTAKDFEAFTNLIKSQ